MYSGAQKLNVTVGNLMNVAAMPGHGFERFFYNAGEAAGFRGTYGGKLIGVYSSDEFAASVKLHNICNLKNKELVIVGSAKGSLEMALIAESLGADVTVIYDRSAEDYAELNADVKAAAKKGICFRFLERPAEVCAGTDKHVTCMLCLETQVSKNGEVITQYDSEYEIKTDYVINMA